MALFKVEITKTIMVIAKNREEAAAEGIFQERHEEPEFIHTSEVLDLKEVHEEWRDSIPYGKNEDEETVREYLCVGNLN